MIRRCIAVKAKELFRLCEGSMVATVYVQHAGALGLPTGVSVS